LAEGIAECHYTGPQPVTTAAQQWCVLSIESSM
jgi:hypothetical protein